MVLLLRNIRDNNIVTLTLFRHDLLDNDDVLEAGRAISANTSLQSLTLVDFYETNDSYRKKLIPNYQPLFRGISQNKSIRSIEIHRSVVDEELSLVFNSESISKLKFHYCELIVDVFILSSRAIKELTFSFCIFKEDENIGSNKRAKLEPFNREVNLETLEILNSHIHLDKNGTNAVSRLLVNPNAIIKAITMVDSVHEEWNHLFVDGLKGCRTLKRLKYNNNLEQHLLQSLEHLGCRYGGEQSLLLLASALPDLTIRELDLSGNQINVDVARELSHRLAQNKKLEKLKLSDLNTTEEAMAVLIPACVGPASSLRTLHLGPNLRITDDMIVALVNLLENNSTLEELDLGGLYNISSTGWLTLARVLGSSRCSLKNLKLNSERSIDDEVITAFANELSNNEILKCLDLTSCEYATEDGWLAFSRLLGSPRSALRKLDISHNNISDSVVAVLTNELIGNENSQLKRLILSDGDVSITNVVVWDTIMNLLCNTSSIEGTRSSNHNICSLGEFNDDENEVIPMPRDIFDLLKLNENEDKKEVARTKVIKHHFSGHFDVNALIGSNQRLLPRKISWFGRDSLGISVVYGIIRTLPALCQNVQN